MTRNRTFKIILLCFLIGFIFALLEFILHANPLVKNLSGIYEPVSRGWDIIIASFIIDIIYGTVLSLFYLILYKSLPGQGMMKGIIYGILLWFLRITILTLTQWMVYPVSAGTIIYMIFAGLPEMIIIGALIERMIKK
ncbi:MAG: hypothetical protein ACLFVR_06540 [Thiohalospira sp.]